MNRHTPGPWRVEVHNGRTSVEGKYTTVATDVTNDDAILIASAPELFKSLKHVLSSIPLTTGSIALAYDIADAQRVINKIEGGW